MAQLGPGQHQSGSGQPCSLPEHGIHNSAMTADMHGKRKMLLLSRSDKSTQRRGQSPRLLLTDAQSVQFLSLAAHGPSSAHRPTHGTLLRQEQKQVVLEGWLWQ